MAGVIARHFFNYEKIIKVFWNRSHHEKTKMANVSSWLKGLLVLLIMLPLRTTEAIKQNTCSDLPFNYSYFVLYLKNNGFGTFEIAQAIHETGHFQSNIFCENNNLFGMKMPKKRKTTACGENRGHATYTTWTDSVNDYLLRKNAGFGMKNYSKDTLYFEKIKEIEKTL